MTVKTLQTIEDSDGTPIGHIQWDDDAQSVKIHIGDPGVCAHGEETRIEVNEQEFHDLLHILGRVGREVFGLDMEKYFNGR